MRARCAFVLLVTLAAGCAYTTTLGRSQVAGLRMVDDGSIVYPISGGYRSVRRDADLLVALRPGAPFEVRQVGSQRSLHAGPRGSRLEVDLERDDLMVGPNGIAARLDGTVYAVPSGSIRALSIREGQDDFVLPVIAAGIGGFLVTGIVALILTDHPD